MTEQTFVIFIPSFIGFLFIAMCLYMAYDVLDIKYHISKFKKRK